MTKKAQTNQIFLYIIAALVLGLIFFVGYKAVAGLLPKMAETEKITFEKTLDQMLRENKNFGTFKNEKIPIPSKYEGICFVDKDAGLPMRAENPAASNIRDDLADQVNIGAASNVFFMTDKGIESLSTYQDEKAQVKIDTAPNHPKNYICIKAVNGILSLKLEGLGKAVLISE